ncbi:MAG: nucleotide exchange factor GrpE [Chlorobi bacterium]|nr:nucleotide exchange factor GrpE [Chlorobiota bacterium]
MKHKKDKMEEDKSKGDLNSDSTAETEVNAVKIDKNVMEKSSSQDKKIAELENQIKELKDRYLRKAAEFDNFKKRTNAEKTEFFAYANEKLISDLLPVLDDFDRILKLYDREHDAESFKKGLELVYDKFKKTLEKQGLKEIDSKLKEFDVNLHEAVMQQPSEAEPNTVLDTVEKGYFLKDKVLRHAKVIVSAKSE